MKFKKGDLVRIVDMEKCLKDDHSYDIGDICELKDIHDGDHDYAVYTTDKNDFWFFDEDQLEAYNEIEDL